MSVPLKPVLQTQPGMEVAEGSFDAVVEAVLEEVVCELVVLEDVIESDPKSMVRRESRPLDGEEDAAELELVEELDLVDDVAPDKEPGLLFVGQPTGQP